MIALLMGCSLLMSYIPPLVHDIIHEQPLIFCLPQRIDGIEDDIIREKVKSNHVGGEMNDTFVDIIHKY